MTSVWTILRSVRRMTPWRMPAEHADFIRLAASLILAACAGHHHVAPAGVDQIPTILPEFVRIIQSQDEWIGVPDFSPDGRWVVYASRPSDTTANLWITRMSDGAHPLRLTTGNQIDYGPIWYASSDRLSFVSNRGIDGGTTGDMHLMSLAIDRETGEVKGPPVALTSEPVGGFGAPSPDGAHVAYPSTTIAAVSRVMLADDSRPARELSAHRGAWARSGPEFLWTSDGAFVFHVMTDSMGRNTLTRVDVGSGSATSIATFESQVAHVDATGRFVLLRLRPPAGMPVSPTTPNHEIATIDGRPIARFAAPRGMWIYRFSADGRTLVAQQSDGAGTSIWRVNIGSVLTTAHPSR
jgi:dipeptidyl aminopeptidase/acylaminoacyl peptidase